MTKEKLYLDMRNKIIYKIKSKYIDFPRILHERTGDGTSTDLIIDEIVVLTIKSLKKESRHVKKR
jgi:hypothetical protein